MERMQVYLARGQRARLGAIARQRSRPVAELVREAVDRYLAAELEPAAESDGLFALVGADAGGESESAVSERHHEVLGKAAHWEGRGRAAAKRSARRKPPSAAAPRAPRTPRAPRAGRR